jgi:hypothetical protein
LNTYGDRFKNEDFVNLENQNVGGMHTKYVFMYEFMCFCLNLQLNVLKCNSI